MCWRFMANYQYVFMYVCMNNAAHSYANIQSKWRYLSMQHK